MTPQERARRVAYELEQRATLETSSGSEAAYLIAFAIEQALAQSVSARIDELYGTVRGLLERAQLNPTPENDADLKRAFGELRELQRIEADRIVKRITDRVPLKAGAGPAAIEAANRLLGHEDTPERDARSLDESMRRKA